jgi:hypothetical protein
VAAGDLVVADYQAELRGTLTGAGTDFCPTMGWIGGLGIVAKTADTDLAHDDGTYPGRDYRASPTLTFPYAIHKRCDADAAGALYRDLLDLWAPSEVTLPLHFRLPGFGKVLVNGRPRGLVPNLNHLSMGIVTALAMFYLPDPTLTFL